MKARIIFIIGKYQIGGKSMKDFITDHNDTFVTNVSIVLNNF